MSALRFWLRIEHSFQRIYLLLEVFLHSKLTAFSISWIGSDKLTPILNLL